MLTGPSCKLELANTRTSRGFYFVLRAPSGVNLFQDKTFSLARSGGVELIIFIVVFWFNTNLGENTKTANYLLSNICGYFLNRHTDLRCKLELAYTRTIRGKLELAYTRTSRAEYLYYFKFSKSNLQILGLLGK